MHRLIYIHRMQTRRIKPREPHIAHDHQLQIITRFLHPIRKRVALIFGVNVFLICRRITCRAGHDHLKKSFIKIIAMPLWAKLDDLVIQFHRNTPTHSHNHSLAFHHIATRFKVRHDIPRHELDTIRRTDHRLKPRPFAFESLFLFHLFAFGQFFKLRINARCLFFEHLDLGKARFVVDWHRRSVFHGMCDVVHIHIPAKDRPRIFVGKLDRCAGKADEGRIGQRIMHMPRKAVDEIILTTVRFVGDHDHITPIGEHRVRVAFFFGHEFLNSCKDNAARRDSKQRAQLRSVVCLLGLLA